MKLQFPHCTYETISDFNLLCYKWRFAIAEFTVKIESGNLVITLPECFQIACTQIFFDASLFCLWTTKSIVFWRGNLSSFLPENMSCVFMWAPLLLRPGLQSRQKLADLEIQCKNQPTLPLSLPFWRARWWLGLSECVCQCYTVPWRNTTCKHSYTDSSYLGSDCNGSQRSYKFGREAMEAGWILALSPLRGSHCNWTTCGLLQFLDAVSQY